MNPVDVIGYGLLAVMLIGSAIAVSQAGARLDDPNDRDAIYLEQLPAVALLSGTGRFAIRVLRQSGNLHAKHEAASAAEAIDAAMTTFRRAKIEAVHISQNSEAVLRFARMFHSHRGSAEGKKVGAVEIVRID